MRTKLVVVLVVGGALYSLLGPLPAGAHQNVSEDLSISALNVDERLPAVAYNWNRDEYLVVWHTSPAASPREIHASWLNRWGRVIHTATIASGATNRAQSSVAYDVAHDSYLVVYMREGSGGTSWDIAGLYVPGDSSGWLGVEQTFCDWSSEQWSPQVVFNSFEVEFFIVWCNIPGSVPPYISGRRILTNGNPNPGAFTVASDNSDPRINPDVAYNFATNQYLVVYDLVVDVGNSDITGQRVSAYGDPLGSEIAIANWPDNEEHPSVAADSVANQYLVTWHNSYPDIYGRFVTGLGVIDGAPIWIYYTTGANRQTDVACDSQHGQCLVAWEEEYAGGVFGIGGRRVLADKTMEPAFILRPGYSDTTDPVVAASYAGFLVAWEEDRSDGSYLDIHGAIAWSLFGDGFESGGTTRWSFTQQ